MIENMDQWEKSKCVIEAWDINDPDLAHMRAKTRQAWAEKMCDGCPLMAKCAQSAKDFGSSGTVWGATYIPEAVYGKDDDWHYKLDLVSMLNRVPSVDEIEEHKRRITLPVYVMNKVSAGEGKNMPFGRRHQNPVDTCKQGHEMVESNIYHPPKRPLVRECRKCIAERHRRRRQK